MDNSTTNTPTGGKVQVSKNLHDQTYQNFMRALDAASCFRLTISALHKELDSPELLRPGQTLGDIQVVLDCALRKLCEVSEFMGDFSFDTHKECFTHYEKSLRVVSILRLTVAAIPEGADDRNAQLFGDIKETLKLLLGELSAVSDFLDTLHFSVMEVKGGES